MRRAGFLGKRGQYIFGIKNLWSMRLPHSSTGAAGHGNMRSMFVADA